MGSSVADGGIARSIRRAWRRVVALATLGLALAIATGAGVYALLSHLLRVPEWQHLWSRVLRASPDER